MRKRTLHERAAKPDLSELRSGQTVARAGGFAVAAREPDLRHCTVLRRVEHADARLGVRYEP
jgi:hypothetical protein